MSEANAILERIRQLREKSAGIDTLAINQVNSQPAEAPVPHIDTPTVPAEVEDTQPERATEGFFAEVIVESPVENRDPVPTEKLDHDSIEDAHSDNIAVSETVADQVLGDDATHKPQPAGKQKSPWKKYGSYLGAIIVIAAGIMFYQGGGKILKDKPASLIDIEPVVSSVNITAAVQKPMSSTATPKTAIQNPLSSAGKAPSIPAAAVPSPKPDAAPVPVPAATPPVAKDALKSALQQRIAQKAGPDKAAVTSTAAPAVHPTPVKATTPPVAAKVDMIPAVKKPVSAPQVKTVAPAPTPTPVPVKTSKLKKVVEDPEKVKAEKSSSQKAVRNHHKKAVATIEKKVAERKVKDDVKPNKQEDHDFNDLVDQLKKAQELR